MEKSSMIQSKAITPILMFFCIGIFLNSIFFIITAAGAYQESTTTSETVVTYSYTQNGVFDFTVNLKNNSVYNKTSIKPGQETIFKSIVDDINGSFIYNYGGDEAAETTGEYYLTAQVTTDLWEKNYAIISKSNFSSNEKTASFNFVFPVNLTFYETIIAKIDEEIGIKASNPTLTIKCNVVVSSQTSKGSIYDSFSPYINVTLGGNIIEFEGDLSQYDTGILTGEQEVFLQSVIDNRNTWAASSIVFIAIIVGFALITGNVTEKYDKTEKMVNKIKKKYGEWMVEVNKPPKRTLGSENIGVKSIEDLIKISEEIGKPVIHHTSSSGRNAKHTFYVFDESIIYEYILADETIKKIALCPNCSTKIVLEDSSGKKVTVTCPKCGEKGIVTVNKN